MDSQLFGYGDLRFVGSVLTVEAILPVAFTGISDQINNSPVLGGLDGTGLESTESAVIMNDGCCVLELLEGDGAIIPFVESAKRRKTKTISKCTFSFLSVQQSTRDNPLCIFPMVTLF